MKLNQLETKTHEVIFLFVSVLVLVCMVSFGCFLFISQEGLVKVIGQNGFKVLKQAFDAFGVALFIIPFCVYAFGKFLLKRAASPKEILQSYKFILLNLVADSVFLLVGASVFAILQHFKNLSSPKVLEFGFGGYVGEFLGGNLYFSWGILGSLSFLVLISCSMGIASGHVHLTNGIYLLGNILKVSAVSVIQSAGSFLFLVGKAIKEKSVDKFQDLYQTYRFKKTNPEEVEQFLLKKIIDESQFDIPNQIEKRHVVNFPGTEKDDQENNEEAKKEKTKLTALPEPTEEEKEPKRKKRGRPSKKPSDSKSEASKGPELEIVPEDEASSNDPSSMVITPYKKRYPKPDISLLKKPVKANKESDETLKKRARFLEERLGSFQLRGKIVKIHPGIRLTMYEFAPDPGVKVSKISASVDDLALMLGAESIRVLTPIPGKTTVGIEVPNPDPSPLLLSEFIPECQKASKTMQLPIAMGKNVFNDTLIADLSEMPHLLVSGTTGSGKSVFTNSMISSLIYTKSPKDLRFIMIDPKMIELSAYNGIPHLLRPVVTDLDEAKDLLTWAMAEMDKRYQQLSDVNARNIVNFNEIIETKTQKTVESRKGKKFDWDWSTIPYIVIVIDELADLMITHGKEVEIPITRLAQKARAAGIHLVIATQRPSAEIVTGLIKTNFPSRIAFKVSAAVDSRTILDASGAEKLLGKGDALFKPNGKPIERIQASFVSEGEVVKVVDSLL